MSGSGRPSAGTLVPKSPNRSPSLGEALAKSTSTARLSPRRFRSRRTLPPLGGQRRTGCTHDGAGLNQWRGPHPRHANRGWAQPSPTDEEELSTGASTLQNNFLSRRATRFGGGVALGPTRKHSSPEKSLQPLQIHSKNHWMPMAACRAALEPERCRQALITRHRSPWAGRNMPSPQRRCCSTPGWAVSPTVLLGPGTESRHPAARPALSIFHGRDAGPIDECG